MKAEADHYAILGVLPDAESVVIVAAYRALASLYHPDKWKGDLSVAHTRMSEINVAYGVLSDAVKRKAYDSTRRSTHSYFKDGDTEESSAFDNSLSELESKWKLAVDIYPDLTQIRERLKKTSYQLAFAFVTVMLESRRFSFRFQVAEAMELSFLKQYFGGNNEILDFVRLLISRGERDAVKAVNRYVEVLGSDESASTIIQKVKEQFNIGFPKANHRAEENFEDTSVRQQAGRNMPQSYLRKTDPSNSTAVVLALLLACLAAFVHIANLSQSNEKAESYEGNTVYVPGKGYGPSTQSLELMDQGKSGETPKARSETPTIYEEIPKEGAYEYIRSIATGRNLEVFKIYEYAKGGKVLTVCFPNAYGFYVKADWDLKIKDEAGANQIRDAACTEREGRRLLDYLPYVEDESQK